MSSTTFAYGSYYDDEVGVLLILLYIVFGVLGLILFFKLWGQTNNVKKLKEKFCISDIDTEIQYNLFVGKFDDVRNLAMKRFFIKAKKETTDVNEAAQVRFENAIKELKNIYNLTGSVLPLIFNDMAKINDFKHLININMQIDSDCLVVVKSSGTKTRVKLYQGNDWNYIYKGEDGTEYQKDDITPYFCPQLLSEAYLK